MDYQNTILSKFPQLITAAQPIDSQIVTITNELHKGFNFVKDLLIASSKCRKPNEQENLEVVLKLQVFFKVLAEHKNIRNNFTNHSTSVYEAI